MKWELEMEVKVLKMKDKKTRCDKVGRAVEKGK